MFDAIEDIPTHKLTQELNSRKATSPPAWTPATRYRHDADELARIADWITANARAHGSEYIALDYFRLADRLAQLSDDAREFARTMGGPIP